MMRPALSRMSPRSGESFGCGHPRVRDAPTYERFIRRRSGMIGSSTHCVALGFGTARLRGIAARELECIARTFADGRPQTGARQQTSAAGRLKRQLPRKITASAEALGWGSLARAVYRRVCDVRNV